MEGLRHLVPADKRASVIFRSPNKNSQKSRKVRETAAVAYLSADGVEVVIQYEDLEDEPTASPARTGSAIPTDGLDDASLDVLLRALDEAERALPFVALKYFRDQFLPAQGADWQDPVKCANAQSSSTFRRRAPSECSRSPPPWNESNSLLLS